ncbi:MAG: hypothetical protein AAFR47_07380 [Pseudomonadota bacterium]
MSNSIALWLGFVLLALIGANFWLGWELHVFLGKKGLDAIAWLAFWR